MSEAIKEAAARAGHEAVSAWRVAIGEPALAPWPDAEGWERESSLRAVDAVLGGTHDPEATHNDWMEGKVADGWVYGPVRDNAAKVHPLLVPFADLPPEQAAKDAIIAGVIRQVLEAGGLLAEVTP